MNVRRSFVQAVALTVVVAMPLLGLSSIASAKATKAARGSHAWCATHPKQQNKAICAGSAAGGAGTGSGTGQPTVDITATVSPNPLVETGQSEIHAVIEVETLPSFAGDTVTISSSQLDASCATVDYESIASGTIPPTPQPGIIGVILDDDGNATVVVNATNCAPGSSVIEADLDVAPYLTALATLVAGPPVVTPSSLTGYPNDEVETGDTTGLSGNSDVYAVFYVEDPPVYAESGVVIGSAQLEARCGQGWNWESGNGGTSVSSATNGLGVNTGKEARTTLDDDGNAVFVFEGASCAAGDSQVIADVLFSGDTYTFDYTVDPPAPTI
jgi:hypothetical protein